MPGVSQNDCLAGRESGGRANPATLTGIDSKHLIFRGCGLLLLLLFHCRSDLTVCVLIGVDLAGILGGRMARAEGGLVPSGVGYAKGGPLFSRLEGLGSVVSSPSGVRGQKRILAFSEGHRTLIFVLILQNLRGTICIIVPLLQILGRRVPLSPRDLRLCVCCRRQRQPSHNRRVMSNQVAYIIDSGT